MFFIIEIKTHGTVSAIVAPIPAYEDKDKAISAYYYKLVYAADPELSQVDLHSVMLVDQLGQVIMRDTFSHKIPEPEEPEVGVGDDS